MSALFRLSAHSRSLNLKKVVKPPLVGYQAQKHDHVLFVSNADNLLFGHPKQHELRTLCPRIFYDERNDWARCASKFLSTGYLPIDGFRGKWRSPSRDMRRTQLSCVSGIAVSLSYRDCVAVVAWMLSRMFVRVPSYRRSRPEDKW